MLEEWEQRNAAGELTFKEAERMAEPWCWVNGCFTVQAVNPDSFRKAPVGVHVFREPPVFFCGSSLGLNVRMGQTGENYSFLSCFCVMLRYCSCSVLD